MGKNSRQIRRNAAAQGLFRLIDGKTKQRIKLPEPKPAPARRP